MAIVITFVSSLLLVLILLLFKAIELRFGKRNFILELLRKLDTRSEKLISTLKFRAWQAIQSVRYLFVVKIRSVIEEWTESIQRKIIHEYKLQQNTVMGRKQIANNGSASFYLKKISEEKTSVGRGKIEDGL
jgi:hypothetical protein